jgi:hypothetical protein
MSTLCVLDFKTSTYIYIHRSVRGKMRWAGRADFSLPFLHHASPFSRFTLAAKEGSKVPFLALLPAHIIIVGVLIPLCC